MAGMTPASRPINNISAPPVTTSRGGSVKTGSRPPVGSPACTMIHATARPRPPATNVIKSDSERTRARILLSVKPTVLSTASSFVRSRTDCTIVLAATKPNINRTVDAIAIMMEPISPTCLAKPSMKPFSVVVFVSAPEFANMASKVRPNSSACEGSSILTTYQPTRPLSALARFSSR